MSLFKLSFAQLFGYEQMNLFMLSFAQLFGIALNKIFDFLSALLPPFAIFVA